MSIKVLFFGNTAQIVGERALTFDDAATTGQLLEHLKAAHPALASARLLVSVNQEYAAADSMLKDGDEVAVFSPVSGG